MELNSKPTNKFQKAAGILALYSSILTLSLVVYWITDSRTKESFGGGVNWDEKIFFYHPLFMTLGFLFTFVWVSDELFYLSVSFSLSRLHCHSDSLDLGNN